MSMHTLLEVMKAVSDEGRLRALMALRHGELCACQMIELLNLAPSTVSKHMSILRQAGLVEARKSGKWVYYRLATRSQGNAAAAVIKTAMESLDRDRIVKADQRALERILKHSPIEKCSRPTKRPRAGNRFRVAPADTDHTVNLK
jgi:ArsR family transcriptional regulator